MRRTLLLTITVLLTVPLLLLPTAQTQEPEKPLPNPANYPLAGEKCKHRVNMSPWVGTPSVVFTETGRCVLSIHTCRGVETFTSGVRRSGTGYCDDYWVVHQALANREICCDQCYPPPPPWFDTSSNCKEVKSPLLSISGGTATLYMCGYPVFYHTEIGLHESHFADNYRALMRDYLRNNGFSQVCCDKFREAVEAKKYCDPRKDLDCIGGTNYEDIRLEDPPDAIPDGFGLTLDEMRPSEPCGQGCEWELIKGKLKFDPRSYDATWRCRLTGRVVNVVKQSKP